MCLAQGPQRSDAGEAPTPRPLGLESSTLPLSHCAPFIVMYLACDTFMENHLTTLDSSFFLKLMPENQGHSGRLTVYVQTP